MNEPTFHEFTKQLSEFYVDDELCPALHVSYIKDSDRWYVAVHRYPHVGFRRQEREVVCGVSRPSFGNALFELYRQWDQIKDLSFEEEQLQRRVLPHLDPEG